MHARTYTHAHTHTHTHTHTHYTHKSTAFRQLQHIITYYPCPILWCHGQLCQKQIYHQVGDLFPLVDVYLACQEVAGDQEANLEVVAFLGANHPEVVYLGENPCHLEAFFLGGNSCHPEVFFLGENPCLVVDVDQEEILYQVASYQEENLYHGENPSRVVVCLGESPNQAVFCQVGNPCLEIF